MSSGMIWGIVAIAVVVLIVLVIGIYNRLVTFRNRFKNAFAQIDVQLKRRYDLIPNLVESSKAYLKHERQTLEAVIQARNQASSAMQQVSADPANAGAMKAFLGAESALSGVMGRLFAVMEAYPDLKANQTIAQLMEELTSTENKISFARQAFNDSVMEYNVQRETFPAVVLAGALGFQAAQLFEIVAAQEREAPKVSF